jgi:hypothetical protein
MGKKKKSSVLTKETVKSLREFKEKYLPIDIEKEKSKTLNPQNIGIEIADKIYDKNKHILLECN